MVSLFAVVFLGIILGVTLLVLTGVYNSLVSLKKQVDLNWQNMEHLLKQRAEHLPAFVQILQEIVPREKVLLAKVIEVQNRFLNTRDLSNKIKISNEMTNLLASLFLVGDAYPELRKSLKFKEARKQLMDVEEALASRQEHFNYTIKVFNERNQQFPDLIFAQTMGFDRLDFFKVYTDDSGASEVSYRLAA